ncbi:TATA box-binding protein [Candidatus Bathyarchaeota archaeon]|nr:MAG: TATA box-binding protein [Candidatus Bathyarchaeota archaeon]
MTKKEPEIKIQNIVASAAVNQTISLQLIVERFPHVEYRPKVFPGLVFRLKKPKTATLIFKTGKMVCTGAKSEKLARQAVNKVTRKLKKQGILSVTSKPIIHIQNIVASAVLGGEIDLENVVYKLKRVMYEPEQFPGAVYRMDNPKVVFLIFSAGKLVCVGAKKEQDVYDAVNKLQGILEEKEVIYYSSEN